LPEEVYVVRQAIFDSRRRAMGYELLYRRSTDSLEHLVRDGLAFVNVTRGFLACGFHSALPPERVVLEIIEHETVHDELIDLLGEVRAEGYPWRSTITSPAAPIVSWLDWPRSSRST